MTAYDPNTPSPEILKPVNTGELNKEDNVREGSSIYERLYKTLTKERFYELARKY